MKFTDQTGPAFARARWQRSTPVQRSAAGRHMRSFRRKLPPSPQNDLHDLVRKCSPTVTETRNMLNSIAAAFGLARTADLLAVDPSHIQHIVKGRTNPSSPLRKHVWMTWSLLLSKEGIPDMFALVTCGRWTLHSGPQHALQPRPATIEPRVRVRRPPKPSTRPGST